MESKLGGGLRGATMGPYRATKLWNDVIRTFRTSLPLGRHRRYMKTYDNCFVATDAVIWLHEHLKENPNFGTTVTRTQTVQLMEKFHKSRVFEDVRSVKHNRVEFSDNGRLYRFTHNSPIKTSRAPLGSKTNLVSAGTQPVKLDLEKLEPITCIPPTGLPECRLVARPLSQKEVTDTWRKYTLQSLEKVVGVESLKDMLDGSLVNGQQVMHNCLFINKNGVVTNIDSKDQLPHWTLSAMRCLAHWPNKVDAIFPRYAGFEKDVFRVVVEYFEGLKEPLLTYDMYEFITNVYVHTEKRFIKHSSPNTTNCFTNTPSSLSSLASVENLILNMTMNTGGPSFRRSVAPSVGQSLFDGSLHLTGVNPSAESSNIYESKQYGSMASLPVQPVTRCETAFGPDNRTVTRFLYSPSLSLDSGQSSMSRDFFSHACIETDLDSMESASVSGEKTRFGDQTYARSNSWSNTRNRVVRATRPQSVNLSRTDSVAYSAKSENRTRSDSQSDAAPASDHTNLHTSMSSGIDNPSFHYGINETIDRKPPLYKPPPRYRHPSGGMGEKVTQKNQSQQNHSYKEQLSSGSLLGPGYKSHELSIGNHPFGPGFRSRLTRFRKSVSFSNLNASPIAQAPDDELGVPSYLKRCGSLPEMCTVSVKERLCASLQLCMLLLPPANRRKLHLLLRMLHKMMANKELSLDDCQPIKPLLLCKFSRSILRSPEEADMDDLLCENIVEFLIENYTQILTVPQELKNTVESQLTQLKLSSARIVYSLEDPSMLTYCKQVSMTQFERQRITNSQEALADLLHDIVQDTSMAQKDKRKRMKQFQKMYPSIYDKRFPTKESEAEVIPVRGKPPLLSRPLHKLRNMRL